MSTSRSNSIADLHIQQSVRAAAWGGLLLLLITAGMVAMIARVAQLKVWPDARLADAAGTSISTVTEFSRRGCLLDRRGRVIASSTIGQRLFIDPQVVEDPSTIGFDLARLLDVDPVEVDRLISPRLGSRYVVVRDLLESWQEDAVRTARFPGVGLEPRLVRHYPHGDLAAGVVGIVGFEHTGLSGLEHLFDRKLRQVDGRLAYLRDAYRHPMWISPDGYRPAVPGQDVSASIDLVVQEIAQRRLESAVETGNAGGGRLVVLDCRSGEILAMTDILRSREGWEEQTEDPARALHLGLGRNRCVTDPYEPGSTFKPFSWAVALQLERVALDETLPTRDSIGYRTSGGRLIRDSHYVENADWITVLVRSINSGMAMVAERMTDAEMQEAIDRFGFGKRTGCGIRGESPGIVTAPESWSHWTQTSVSMGHEIAVTPVQMVRGFSAFARNGTLPRLRVTAVGPNDGGYQLVERALPESIALTAREAMAEVVSLSSNARVARGRFRMFGKSGTAQLPKREGGGYHEDRYVSSYIAGAPFDDPRIVVLCIIDDPDRSLGHYGSQIAGPVVREVVEEVLAYMGVAPDAGGLAGEQVVMVGGEGTEGPRD